MVDEMKEGIMEDNRKGTWEDVTKECELQLDTSNSDTGKYVVYVRHGSGGPNIRAALGTEIQGWIVEGARGGRNDARYRLVQTGSVGALHCGSFRIEHFTPDPKEEWVDVTDELHAEMGLEGYVNVWHGEICVLSFGSRRHEYSGGKANYRVTTTETGSAGRFKVEKRND